MPKTIYFILSCVLLSFSLFSSSHATTRTWQCANDRGYISYDATDALYGAIPNDSRDDHSSISKAITRAYETARSMAGDCIVQVFLQPGTYDINSTLLIPSRVLIKGRDFKTTKIHYHGNVSAVQIGNINSSTDPVRHVRVKNLTITMNNSDGAGGGHCIRSPRGFTDVEFEKLKLIGCDGYGIGMQRKGNDSNDAPYERVTLREVKIETTGSDGIDMKAFNTPNNDIEFYDMCVLDIAHNDDGAWASAIDLAGNNISIDRFTFINPSPVVNGANVNGIDVNAGSRTITNSYIGDFYIERAAQGVIIAPDGASRNILFGSGVVKDSTVGIRLDGNGHTNDGKLCVVGSTSDSRKFDNGGNDIQLSPSCPTSTFFTQGNPVCSF